PVLFAHGVQIQARPVDVEEREVPEREEVREPERVAVEGDGAIDVAHEQRDLAQPPEAELIRHDTFPADRGRARRRMARPVTKRTARLDTELRDDVGHVVSDRVEARPAQAGELPSRDAVAERVEYFPLRRGEDVWVWGSSARSG